MQHYLLATSWLICNQFHALTVRRASRPPPARRRVDASTPGVDSASTQRRPASTTQVDTVDAYHTWLASTCFDLRRPCVDCVCVERRTADVNQNGKTASTRTSNKQRQIGVKGVKSGLCAQVGPSPSQIVISSSTKPPINTRQKGQAKRKARGGAGGAFIIHPPPRRERELQLQLQLPAPTAQPAPGRRPRPGRPARRGRRPAPRSPELPAPWSSASRASGLAASRPGPRAADEHGRRGAVRRRRRRHRLYERAPPNMAREI
jgi:hypothetical protein